MRQEEADAAAQETTWFLVWEKIYFNSDSIYRRIGEIWF